MTVVCPALSNVRRMADHALPDVWDGHIRIGFAKTAPGADRGCLRASQSPDHGTAYDIAWKGIADPSSMKAAIDVAARMAQVRIAKRAK